MKQGVILAGGKGTRIAKISNGLPKALMPINGKPLILYQIDLLKKNNITEILILSGYLSEKIEEELKDGSHLGVNIKYINEPASLGTAGALISALGFLKDTFIVLYSDTLLNVELSSFLKFHYENNADVSLFVHPNSHPYDSDIVEVDENNMVKKFHSYPHPKDIILPNLVNAALYIIRKKILVSQNFKKQQYDICKDLFPQLLDYGHAFYAYNSSEYIKDMGTPERYKQVQLDFINGIFEKGSIASSRPAIFLDRDGTLNEYKGYISRKEDLKLLTGVGQTIKKINKSGFLSVLVTNQPVVARGSCTLNELKLIHWKLEMELAKEGAFLDRIYFCPHHPEGGFSGEIPEYKIKCDCRKPCEGMIKKAVNELNIDLSSSWFIGDTTTDLECARIAKIKSILVRTGKMGEDYKYSVKPDFEFFNLEEAFNFINNNFDLYKEKLKSINNLFNNNSLIAIGGKSRSGKSNLASCLRLMLEESGNSAVVISLDHWLHSKQERKNNLSVFNNYDIPAIIDIINKIKYRKDDLTLEVPIYKRSTQTILNNMTYKIKIKKNEIVIIEGVIALGVKEIMNLFDFMIYLKISETVRKSRILKEYALLGKTEEEITEIYSTRLNNEYSIIDETQKNANYTLILGAEMESHDYN